MLYINSLCVYLVSLCTQSPTRSSDNGTISPTRSPSLLSYRQHHPLRILPGIIMPNIFVFGSNLAGRHGKGAALYAKQHHGAIYGQGVGLQGNSYAIPTKDQQLRTLPISKIYWYVLGFLLFAKDHPELTFNITRIGCGLAGYKDHHIKPLFSTAPANCILPKEWTEHAL